MTLITALVARKWVAIASDRRVTYVGGSGTPIWQEDATVKSVVHDGRYVLGFAGVVPPDPGHVDMWLAAILSQRRTGRVDAYLQNALQDQWDSDPALDRKPAAVVAVGFKPDGTTHGFLISNALTPQGDLNPHNVSARFRRHGFSSPAVRTLGEYTDDETRSRLAALVEADGLLTPPNYENLVAAMVQVQHEVSDGSEGRVGREFVLTTLPLHAVGDTQLAMMPLAPEGLAGDAVTKHLVGVTFDGDGRLAVSFAPGGALSKSRGGMAWAGIELRPGSARQIGPRPTLGPTPPSQQHHT